MLYTHNINFCGYQTVKPPSFSLGIPTGTFFTYTNSDSKNGFVSPNSSVGVKELVK